MNPHQNAVKCLRSVVCSAILIAGCFPSLTLKTKALNLDGSFVSTGYNNPISITELSLKAYDESSNAYLSVNSLTPTETYRISFTVADYDGLGKVLIEVSLLHDPDGNVDSDTNGIDDSFEGVAGINSDGDQFDFFWDPTLGQDPDLLIEDNAVSSWTLVSHNLNTLDLDSISATLTFDVTVSKAAIADDLWTLNVRATDDYTGTSTNATMAVARLETLSVQWYGEIASTEDTLNWGTLDHATDYSSSEAKTQLSMTVWANGPFEQQIKADSTWSGLRQSDTAIGLEGDMVSATLVNDVTSSPDQSFALRANLDDSASKGYTAGFVQLSSAMKVLHQSEFKTTEAGLTSTLSVYLSLSERFQNGAYSGTVYVGIAKPSAQ